MILDVFNVVTLGLNGRSIRGRRVRVQCDCCGVEFVRKYNAKYIERENHSCTRKCSNNSEHMKRKTRQTCLERFGVESAMQSDVVKQHQKETMLRKYGVKYACEIPHVKASAQTPAALLSGTSRSVITGPIYNHT